MTYVLTRGAGAHCPAAAAARWLQVQPLRQPHTQTLTTPSPPPQCRRTIPRVPLRRYTIPRQALVGRQVTAT